MSEQTQRRPMRGPHGGPPGMAGEKAKNFKGTIGKLLRYIGNYKFAVLLVCVFAACSTVFNVVGPKILGNATTDWRRNIPGRAALISVPSAVSSLRSW